MAGIIIWEMGQGVYEGSIPYFGPIADELLAPVAKPEISLTANTISSSQIDLSWITDLQSDFGFNVERSLNAINFTYIGTDYQNKKAYSDSGLAGSTTYFYRICGYDSSGNPEYSNIVNATTLRDENPDSNLIDNAGFESGINLWQTHTCEIEVVNSKEFLGACPGVSKKKYLF